MLIESLFTAFSRAAYSREWNIFPQTSQLNPAIRAFPRPRHRGPACGGISGHGEKRCSSLPAGTCSFGLASERTPFARPPHQLKVFEEEGEGFGEREGKLSPESFPSRSPCSLNSPSSHLHPCAACRRTWRRPPTGKARCSRLHHWGKPLCRCLRTWKGRPARGTTARA